MASNFTNSSQRAREYSYRTQTLEDYNPLSANYESYNLWQDNNTLSPRLSDTRRLDTLSVHSSNQNDSATKSKDEFVIFGSFVRQRSEKRSNEGSFEKTKTIPRQSTNYKNLPVKVLMDGDSEYNQILKSENVTRQKSRPNYSYRSELPPDSLFDLIQSNDHVDGLSTLPPRDFVEKNVYQEPIVSLRKTGVENAIPLTMNLERSDDKDKEIVQLKKIADRQTKKISVLTDNNKKLQEHLRNVLDERKQILQHMDNSEFEEIIEEEEVKKAKPRDNKLRTEYVQEKVTTPTEISHANCLQRGRITLDDIPQSMLESFKTDIVRHEKERTDSERRSLIESLKMQQDQKLQLLQAEFQAKQRAFQHVSVQSIKKTQFHQKVSEVNLERTPSPKPDSRSIGINAFPTLLGKQCQSDESRARSPLLKYMAKTSLTQWQRSVVEKVLKHVENGNYDGLVGIFEEVLCPSTTSVGINNTPLCLCKSTNTAPVVVESNKPIEVVKQRVSQESRGTLAKPVLIQRGCQPEDTFKFETGTMTDQKFCRSQGVMTVLDYPDYRTPPNVLGESVVNRTSSRSESRKQKISQTTYINSPTKELVSIQERSISPKVNQVTKKSPKIESENIIEIKTTKTDNAQNMRSVNIVEETKHTVGESTQQVISVLDKNKIHKSDVPVTVECWETISRLKDGEVIEKTETYHDRLVSTDLEKIKEHLDQHEQYTEQSPTARFDAEYFKKESQPFKSDVSESIEVKSSTAGSSVNVSNLKSNFEKDKTKLNKSFSTKENSSPNSSLKYSEKKGLESIKSISSDNSSKSTSFKDIKSQPNASIFPAKEIYSESEHTITSSVLKKPSEYKEIKIQQNMSTPLFKETSSRESEYTIDSSTIMKKTEIKDNTFNLDIKNEPFKSKEVKVEQNFSRLPRTETSYHESEHIMTSSILKNPLEYKEIKVRSNLSSLPFKETSYSEITSSSLNNDVESKEIKIQQNLTDAPFREASYSVFDHESASSKLSDLLQSKDVKIQPWKETSYIESDNIVTSSSFRKPLGGREIKGQQILTTSPFKETTYIETEHRVITNSLKNPTQCNEIKIQPNLFTSPINDKSYYESEYSSSSTKLRSSPQCKEIHIQDNVNVLPLNETSFIESEHTYMMANSSRIPGDKANIDTYQPLSSKVPSPTSSIGILTSPTSFQSYSSSKARSNFSSSKRETFKFESELKAMEALQKMQPVQMNSRTESSEYTIPVSSEGRTSRIPVQSSNSTIRSTSTTSSNSAFHSLPSNKEENQSCNIPVTVGHSKRDCSEILLSENIFQCCSELLLWMKNTNVISTSTIDQLPASLVTVSATLVGWWADLTMKVDSDELMAIVKYMTSTFSKNLLKYLVVSMDQQGNTCLHYIVGHQLWDSFKVIDSVNLVDPNIYNSQGYTVLMLACTTKATTESSLDNLRKLATGANMNLKSKIQGQTALYIAALHDNSQVIQMLYTMGADPNSCDNIGNTPLMIACENNNLAAATTLLSVPKVSLDLKNKEGKTAVEIAEAAQFTDLLEVLYQRRTTKVSGGSAYSRVLLDSSRSSGSSKH